MQVILLERIERLGQMGDEVTVKAGYARNYLLPGGKALRATKENRERFDSQRAQLEAQNLTRRTEAEALAQRMDGLKVVLIRQAGESGQLYGSVTARDISQAVTEAGFTLDRGQVQIERPIKELGLHDVRIMLHPEVQVTVQANVAQTEEAAILQAEAAERGEPLAATAADEAAAGETPEQASVTAAEARDMPAKETTTEADSDRAKAD